MKIGRPKSTTDSICLVCNKVFYRRTHGRPDKPKYCSHECYWKINIGKNNYHWKGGYPKCLDCEKELSGYDRKRCVICLHKRVFGKNNPNWRGGKTSAYNILKGSSEYKEWRLKVFRRDGFKCVLCGSGKSGTLNADHINPRFLYPELTFNVDNGRTLCITCHKNTDTFGSKIYSYAKRIY